MCLCVVPEGGTVKVTAVRGLEGNPRTPAGDLSTDGTGNLFKPGGQHDLLSEEMVSDRENTIENIYPPEKQHPWMDHPENKASGIIDVQRLMEILKGYEASLKAARKECEWMEKHGG